MTTTQQRTTLPPVLAAACGGRMMWLDKNDPRILAQDIRRETVTMTDRGCLRTLDINPHLIGDFRNMEWIDETFNMILFDPPHLVRAGESSWLFKKYGRLSLSWKNDLIRGFRECWRCLKAGGTLVFKWNSCQISAREVSECFPAAPLFVSRQGKTYFYIFVKI